MKIESVEVTYVGFELTGSQAYVQIITDDGTRGLGQSGGWGSAHAVGAIIEDLRPVLIGADPFRIEHLWYTAYRARPFRGNYLSSAVSAIDIALWDIKGQALQVPVWELLGGSVRDRIRLHALLFPKTPQEAFDMVAQAAAEGFTAVKLDPLNADAEQAAVPRQIQFAKDMGAAARDAAGQEVDIIFELHRRLDPARARVVAGELARFAPLFIEDPVQIDSLDVQAEICKHIPAPVATGERLSTIWEFRELLSHNVPICVRPDVGLAGGLTGTKKIAAIAEAHHCGVSPHNFLGPGLTAPTAHLCATLPNLVTMEYYQLDETAGSSRAIDTALTRSGGYYMLPSQPGLGIRLRDDHADLAPITSVPISRTAQQRADGSLATAL